MAHGVYMHNSRECGYTLILLLVSTVTSAQAAEEFRSLVINDLSGKVVVMEVGGKTYVDLKRFVQIGHGTMEYRGNQIVVRLSCSSMDTPAKTTEEEQSISLSLSRDFM